MYNKQPFSAQTFIISSSPQQAAQHYPLEWHKMDVPDVEIDDAEEEISSEEGEDVGDEDEQQSMNYSDPNFDSSEVNFKNIQLYLL